ncbi:phage holin family protein [Nocardioides sp. HDW12B]|nr:phage holin family protein [Nocardioides sp. HDW12B]
MTEQTSTLVRSEMELAKAEIQQTVKDVGRGAGLFGASGVLALYGGGALVATVILGLSTFLDGWLAALIVTVVLFAIAGVAALAGKKKVQQAAPPVEATKRNVARDIAAVKEARS